MPINYVPKGFTFKPKYKSPDDLKPQKPEQVHDHLRPPLLEVGPGKVYHTAMGS